ncbi:MAG: hypothetical protein HYU37_12210 [Acidobacteria bacterium]|nr:hypothetical protein [Acidobacteriota bacterium]
MPHCRLVVALAVLLCVAVVSPASATVLLPADFETVVSESVLIVYGRVVDVRSAVSAPPRGIETFVTVAVVDALKGSPGPRVMFRVPNGQVGRYRRVLVGAPEFEEGDEVVVFLDGRPPAVPALFGLNQGVYRVARHQGAPTVVMREGAARGPLALTAFAREIDSILERRR